MPVVIGLRRVFTRRTVRPLPLPQLLNICQCIDYRQDVDRRRSIVTPFLARLTLSEDEMESLISGNVPIGRRFFDVMDKARAIRADCRVLMSGEDRPSQAG